MKIKTNSKIRNALMKQAVKFLMPKEVSINLQKGIIDVRW